MTESKLDGLKVYTIKGKHLVEVNEVKKYTVPNREIISILNTVKTLPFKNNVEHVTTFILDNLGLNHAVMAPKVAELSNRYKRATTEFRVTDDKTIEWQCTHGKFHTMFAPQRYDMKHKCCRQNCCYELRRKGGDRCAKPKGYNNGRLID